jgi:uncharacterized protein YndB with AHSA1/START domain
MLKWIGGCLVVVVILIAGGSYFAMRTMKESLSADGSARVAIHAPVSRVFASLSHGDSAATYMAVGNKVTTSRRGPFQPGDSVRIEMRTTLGMKPQPMIWLVREIVPDQKIVFQMNSVGARPVTATRVDSLFAKGDSTVIVTRLATSLPDSAKSSATGDVMMTMFQMQSKLELESLKIRIEGRPSPAPRR